MYAHCNYKMSIVQDIKIAQNILRKGKSCSLYQSIIENSDGSQTKDSKECVVRGSW